MARRKMSLSRELYTLMNAIEAGRILSDQLGTQQYATPYDEHRAPHAAAAILVLVGERIRNLRRAIQDDIDPRILVGNHNVEPDDDDIDSDHEENNSDVYLTERSAEQRKKHHAAELGRAERQLQRKRETDAAR